MSAAPAGKSSSSIASLVFMTASVVGLVAFLAYSIVALQHYKKLFKELGMVALPLPTEFFIECPVSIYVAVCAPLAVASLLKEFVVEDKALTLKLNIATAAGVLLLWGAWAFAFWLPFQKVQQDF